MAWDLEDSSVRFLHYVLCSMRIIRLKIDSSGIRIGVHDLVFVFSSVGFNVLWTRRYIYIYIGFRAEGKDSAFLGGFGVFKFMGAGPGT